MVGLSLSLSLSVSLKLHATLEKHGLPDVKLRWTETEGQTFHREQKGEEEEGIPLCLLYSLS